MGRHNFLSIKDFSPEEIRYLLDLAREIKTHPAAHHGHGGDDEIKPREERSYLEFFPFLNTASRLYVVGINDANPTEPQSGATSGQARGRRGLDLREGGPGYLRGRVDAENVGKIDAANLRQAYKFVASHKARGKLVLAGW